MPPPSVPLRVAPGDPQYRRLAEAEAAYWARQAVVEDLDAMRPATSRQFLNETYTGDPARSWFDDLVARGPYRAEDADLTFLLVDVDANIGSYPKSVRPV